MSAEEERVGGLAGRERLRMRVIGVQWRLEVTAAVRCVGRPVGWKRMPWHSGRVPPIVLARVWAWREAMGMLRGRCLRRGRPA